MNDEQQQSPALEDPWCTDLPTRPEALANPEETEARSEPAADEASDNELAFEFVKQLATELSEGSLNLPSLPGVVMRIKSVLDDDNSTVDTIARVIGSEPALAARLLTMCNSAAFRRGSIEITDLKSAVGRMGRDQIRTSAMSFAMQNLMNSQTVAQVKPRLTALWKHSIEVAAMANTIGKRVDSVNADEAMFVGLIHDVGKLYILSRVGKHPELFRCPTVVEQIMVDWHSEIGKAIVESWELPEHLATIVAEHEDEERHNDEAADMLDVLIVANQLANAIDSDSVDEIDFDKVSAFARLQIDAISIGEFAIESRQEVDNLMLALRG